MTKQLTAQLFRCSVGLVGLALSLATPIWVWAQTESVTEKNGFQPNRDYLALQPWEFIDTAGGNIVLTFTDLELPGNNGHSLKFQRTFNNMPVSLDPAAHWRFSVSDIPMRVTTPDIPVGAQILNTVTGERFWTPAFYKADGSLQQTNFMNDPDTSSQSQLTNTTRWVNTPSFWRYDRIDRTLYLPDGRVAVYDPQGWLTTITDRFSNAVTLTWSGNRSALTVVQSLGQTQARQVDIQLNPAVGLPLQMTYEGKTWTYTYEQGAQGELREVHPPAATGWPGGPGRPWLYEYEAGYGNITRVITPLGGVVDYTYDVKQFVFSPTHTDYVRTLVQRSTTSGFVSGTWIFDYRISGQGGPLAGMTAFLPGSSAAPPRRVEYSYTPVSDDAAVAGGWLLDGVIVYEGAGTTPVEFEQRQYTAIPGVRPNRIWYSPEESLRRITRGIRAYETEYSYNLADTQNFANFHRPSSIIERTAGEERRRTNLTYRHLSGPLALPYVVGLPGTEDVIVGSDHAVRSWTYDDTTAFRLTESAMGSVTTFTPDANGNVQRVTKANNKFTDQTYSFGQLAITTTSEPGYSITRAINSDGTIQSMSQGGRTTTYQYDALGRVRLTQPPGSTEPIRTDYVDETVGQSVTVRRGLSTTTTRTDGFGRPVSTVNSAGVQTQTTYDAEGRRVFVSLPFEGSPSTPPGTTFAYDNYGRIVSETYTNGPTRTRTYGTNDTVTVRDENAHDTLLTYSTFGHPDDAVLTGVHDAANGQWTYSYNAIGALTRVVSPDGIQRTWNYHPDTHRLLSETHPESGTVNYTMYDAAGVLKQTTDAKGAVINYGHDGNDRLTSVQAGTEITTITYEPGSDNRATMTVAGGPSTVFEYDGGGRLHTRTDTVDGKMFTSAFDYDANDNLLRITYPSNRKIEYAFDNENRIFSVTNANTNAFYASGFQYHPSGAVSSFVFGNARQTAIGFHPSRYWVSSIDVGDMHLTYGYDGVGNITSITDSRSDKSQTFSYDAVDRLKTAVSQTFNMLFNYDAHGNRQTANNVTYTYESGNPFRLTSVSQGPSGMHYDPNGNLDAVNGGVMTMTYSAGNLLKSTTISGGAAVTYGYDADDWRVKKVVNSGAPTYYLRGPNGQLLTEWQNASSNATVKDYIYAGSRLIAVQTATLPPK